MSTLLTPPRPPAPPTPVPAAAAPLRPTRFLAGYARLLLVPVAGLAALLTGWVLGHGGGWAAAAAAVAGWSAAVVVWLRRRGWPAAAAHLAAWAAPGALLVPLAGLGRLSADGLVVWAPLAGVLAVALAVVHDPRLAGARARTR